MFEIEFIVKEDIVKKCLLTTEEKTIEVDDIIDLAFRYMDHCRICFDADENMDIYIRTDSFPYKEWLRYGNIIRKQFYRNDILGKNFNYIYDRFCSLINEINDISKKGKEIKIKYTYIVDEKEDIKHSRYL